MNTETKPRIALENALREVKDIIDGVERDAERHQSDVFSATMAGNQNEVTHAFNLLHESSEEMELCVSVLANALAQARVKQGNVCRQALTAAKVALRRKED